MTQEETERLRSQLHRRDPAPFVEALAVVLEARPSPEDLKAWAAKHPDGWGRLTKALAPIVGYTVESIAVDHSHRLVFEAMSDSELIAFAKAQRKALPFLDVIEAKAEPVEGGPANVGPDPGDLRRMGLGEPATEQPNKPPKDPP